MCSVFWAQEVSIDTDGRPEPFYWLVTINTPGLNASTRVDLDFLHHRGPPPGAR
jgi:hypothetical protein